MLFWGLRPTRKKIIFIYCCSLQWHQKRFLLLWQFLKWQKISIWKRETFLPFDIWYGYPPAMFIYRISSYKALPWLIPCILIIPALDIYTHGGGSPRAIFEDFFFYLSQCYNDGLVLTFLHTYLSTYRYVGYLD